MNNQISLNVVERNRERAIVHSALWAAAGDALGWITELSRGEAGVERRAGVEFVTEPIAWKRKIGGWSGVSVPLPAGTYSDDTQLRLAVSRAIRGDGHFDVEPFAKVELPVWTSYALGGGRGTKAAASNLSKRSVNWFSNFFKGKEQGYVVSGGNGAAMRIQPHVWAAPPGSDRYLPNVLKDALVSHGHPHGFCGAFFHALALNAALENGRVSPLEEWSQFVERILEIPEHLSREPQIAAFWRAAWESEVGSGLNLQIARTRDEAFKDLDRISRFLSRRDLATYPEILRALGCLEVRYRGSGLKTALAASVLAWLNWDRPTGDALIASANELESDTDTIATMAGALLGAVSDAEPSWSIQDREYIVLEAHRLASISSGNVVDSFNYPDLSLWNPPTKQFDAVGTWRGGLAIAGLGRIVPVSEEYLTPEAVWQWFELEFGQSVLIKRRPKVVRALKESQLPGPRQPPAERLRHPPMPKYSTPPGQSFDKQDSLPLSGPDFKVGGNQNPSARSPRHGHQLPPKWGQIDDWTDRVIRSDFDERLLGELLLQCIDNGGIENAIALTSIVSKARLARRRRNR